MFYYARVLGAVLVGKETFSVCVGSSPRLGGIAVGSQYVFGVLSPCCVQGLEGEGGPYEMVSVLPAVDS